MWKAHVYPERVSVGGCHNRDSRPSQYVFSVKQGSLGSAYNFQPRQIVCLEHENTRLYTEVIEVVTARQICWVRPLMLVVLPLGNNFLPTFSPEQLNLYDLRQGSDLLWPISLFRAALDTEVIPLFVELDNPNEGQQANHAEAHQQLSNFIRKVWQASKNAF